ERIEPDYIKFAAAVNRLAREVNARSAGRLCAFDRCGTNLGNVMNAYALGLELRCGSAAIARVRRCSRLFGSTNASRLRAGLLSSLEEILRWDRSITQMIRSSAPLV